MSLKRKLARLASAGPGSQPVAVDPPETTHPPPVHPPVTPAIPLAPLASVVPFTPDGAAARVDRIADLRARIQALLARPGQPRAHVAAPPGDGHGALPFAREDTPDGPVYSRARSYEATQRHGAVPLSTALDARADAVATLALDPGLRAFDPSRALFLDTETTGLAGGTGTLVFLVGVATFDARRFRVEQLFLAEPCDERAMLVRLRARIEAASALVTYNGKAFDMPLLRSRFVLARLPPPAEPPHLDLVHVARRIYGARVDACRLTTLERDVLGFVREDDVPSSEIPARYVHFLRAGDPGPLVGVVEHNLWDVVAMAALVGELAARVAGHEARGRCEPSDMAALARTALRAGAHDRAVALADDAAAAGALQGEHQLAARAHALAADVHRRRGDPRATRERLLDALALAPDDPGVHLSLAKLYEHKLRDPARALAHARCAGAAEAPDENARRMARLGIKASGQSLRLPGID